MQHPRWRVGRLSTGFIAEEFPEGFRGVAAQPDEANALAAIAATIDFVAGERKRRISGQLIGRPVVRDRTRVVRLGDLDVRLRIEPMNGGYSVYVLGDGEPSATLVISSTWKPGTPVWHGLIDGEPADAQVRAVANGFLLSHRGIEVAAYVYTETEAAAARLMPVKSSSDTGKLVLCPMPGLVRSIAVSAGQEVKAGDALAVVEAMKMENLLRAERDGKVKTIHARPGDSLAVDAVILEFE
jgi:propionyl-CoA carboxylase alpha chain